MPAGTVGFRAAGEIESEDYEEVLEEPAARFWGARDAAVRDPAGNRVRIEQA